MFDYLDFGSARTYHYTHEFNHLPSEKGTQILPMINTLRIVYL